MKSLVPIFVVSCFLCTCSNKIDEEYFAYNYYFEIIDEHTSESIFDANPDYVFDKTLHYDRYTTSIGSRVIHKGRKLLSLTAVRKTEFFIDYGNGDTDTVTQIADPMNNKTIPHRPKKVNFFLNGKETFEFNFLENDTLQHSLERLNDPNYQGFDPIIITLKKSI